MVCLRPAVRLRSDTEITEARRSRRKTEKYQGRPDGVHPLAPSSLSLWSSVSPCPPCCFGVRPFARSRLCILAFSLLLGTARQAAAGNARGLIRQRGEVVIGTDATYPPFEEKVGDGFQGFDIGLGNAIARELGLGVKARWINISFDGIFAALLSGKFDMVMSGVTITTERQKQMAFSDPYYNSGQIIAVRKENRAVRRPEDLKGQTVAVQLGTTGQFAMEKVGGINIRKYNDLNLALLEVSNGRAEAAVGDLPAVREMIRKGHPKLKTVGSLLSDEKVGRVMRQGEPELAAAVNEALTKVRATGE